MLRPLLTFASAFMAGAAALCLLPWLLPWLPGALLLAGVAFACGRPKGLRPYALTICGGMLCACGAFALFWILRIAPFAGLAGQSMVLRGTVLSVEEREGYSLCLLRGSFPGAPGLPSSTLRLFIPGDNALAVGDHVEGEAALSLPRDYAGRRLLYSQGRYLDARMLAGAIAPAAKQERGFSLAAWGAGVRRDVAWAIERAIPGEMGGMIGALLLSERAALPPAIGRDFRRSGVSHILVVSGYHLSLLTGLLLALLGLTRLPEWAVSLLAGAGCLAVMAVVGFTPSIVRSGVMLLLFLAGRALGCRQDSLTALGAAGLVMSLANPYVLLSWSFLLSAGSTLSILLLEKPIYEWCAARMEARRSAPGPAGRVVLSALSVTLAAAVLAYPLQSILFGGLPTYGLAGNLLLTPLVPLVLVGGALAAGLGLLGWWSAAAAVGWLAALGGKIMCNLAAGIAALPGSWLPITEPYQVLWLWSAALLLLALALRRPPAPMAAVACTGLAAALLVGAVSFGLINSNTLELVTQEEGLLLRRGDAALLLGPMPVEAARSRGAWRVLLVADDRSLARRGALQDAVVQAGPAMAVLSPDALAELSPYLPASTQALAVGKGERLVLSALGGVQLTFAGDGAVLIEMGSMRMLKLSRGYVIMKQDPRLEGLDALILPDGTIRSLNPGLRTLPGENGAILRLRMDEKGRSGGK